MFVSCHGLQDRLSVFFAGSGAVAVLVNWTGVGHTSALINAQCEAQRSLNISHTARRQRRDQSAHVILAHRLDVIQVNCALGQYAVILRCEEHFRWNVANIAGDRRHGYVGQERDRRIAGEYQDWPAFIRRFQTGTSERRRVSCVPPDLLIGPRVEFSRLYRNPGIAGGVFAFHLTQLDHF